MIPICRVVEEQHQIPSAREDERRTCTHTTCQCLLLRLCTLLSVHHPGPEIPGLLFVQVFSKLPTLLRKATDVHQGKGAGFHGGLGPWYPSHRLDSPTLGD